MSELVTPTARLLLPSDASENEWHAVRRTGVGGSDVAAILGMDRYKGPLHVWQAKRGELEQQRDTRLERAARRGHRLESLVAEFFAEETGHVVTEAPGTLQHIDHPHWLANLDRTTHHPDKPADPSVLECKSRTWRSARMEGWHSEEAPDGPSLQACWYMAVTGYRAAYLAGLVDDDFVWFRLERDEELIGLLTKAVDDFWHDHVLTGIPPKPDGSKATTELLARLWGAEEEAVAEVDPIEATLLLARREALTEKARPLVEALTKVDNELKALLGEAEIATIGGRPAYSWKQNGVLATARFAEAHPEIVAAHQRQVSVPDWDAIKTAHPEKHRAHRARVLRISEAGS